MLRPSRGLEAAGSSSAHWTLLPAPVVPATEEGAAELGRLYLGEVRRATLRIVQPRTRAGRPALSLLGLVDLIAFGKAETSTTPARVECRFPIVGGLLVGRGGGSLTVVQRAGSPPELGLVVDGYHPRLATSRSLGRALYDNVQARLHVAISNRFLSRMRERGR